MDMLLSIRPRLDQPTLQSWLVFTIHGRNAISSPSHMHLSGQSDNGMRFEWLSPLICLSYTRTYT